MRRFFSALLPVFGAFGFVFLSEMSLRRSHQFFWWSALTAVWILAIFAALVRAKLRSRLTPIAVPAVLMIAFSMVVSLLFLNLVAPRHGFILFFALVLYLFFEHVRREDTHDNLEDRLSISEFARMVNIGSLFLIASVGLGLPAFLPIQDWWTALPFAALAALWSWHLFLACTSSCVRPGARVSLTTLIVFETYVVAQSLPTSMFVGGALVGIVYYLAANLLPLGATESIPGKLVRKYALYAGTALTLILLTARWV